MPRDATLTADGHPLGTPNHISPEQVRGIRGVDCRSDIYSLGVVMYHVLTGVLPFEGQRDFVIAQQLNAEPRPLRRIRKGLAADLEAVCLKCLNKWP